MPEDLRGFLERLRVAGELVEIAAPVAPAHQVAALLERVGSEDGPALLLGRIAGYPGHRMAGNLFGRRRRMALALSTSEDELDATLQRRRAAAVHARRVGDGPVREVIVRERPDVLEQIPVPTHYEGDVGPYIASGVVIARQPGGGRLGMGIHRIQVKGPDRLGIFLHSPPLGEFLRDAEAAGKPLEVAVVLGAEPAVTFAGVARVRPDEDKMELAGGLAGAAIELVDGISVDVPVPANAETVIEGRVLPGVRETDGPFGESTGTYLSFQSPVVEVTAISRRAQPIYPAILPWSAEVDLLMELTIGNETLARLQAVSPCVRALRMSLGTCGLQAVIRVRPSSRQEVREALVAVLGIDRRTKLVIAVDEDVDPASPREVAWAMATRMQPDRDLVVLSDLPGYVIDPSARGGSSAKLGIDATLRPEEMERWRRARVPAEAAAWAASILAAPPAAPPAAPQGSA